MGDRENPLAPFLQLQIYLNSSYPIQLLIMPANSNCNIAWKHSNGNKYKVQRWHKEFLEVETFEY